MGIQVTTKENELSMYAKEKNSLIAERQRLVDELKRLNIKREVRDQTYGPGADYTDHLPRGYYEETVGTPDQIMSVQKRLDQINNRIKEIDDNKEQWAEAAVQEDLEKLEQKRREEEEYILDEKTAESRRIATFNRIKRSYYKEKGKGLARVLIAIDQKRRINWNKIAKYDQERLTALELASLGSYPPAIASIEESRIKFRKDNNASETDIRKYKEKYRWDTFVTLLSNKSRLDRAIGKVDDDGLIL